MNVSLRLLRAFVAASREGHVGRAAAKLYVSQPSLSQDIRRLERELGVELFDRGPKGLTLTASGQEFLRAVESSLTILDRGIAQAREIAVGERPVVSIGYSPSLGNRLMPELLPVLEREFPSITFDLIGVDTGEVAEGVTAGRFDLGLEHGGSAAPELAMESLVDEPLVVALGTEHPLAGRDLIAVAELQGSELMIWPRDTAPEYYDRIFEFCAAGGLQIERVREFRRSMTRSYLFNEDDVFSILPLSASFLHLPGTTFVAVSDDHGTVPLASLTRAGDERPVLRRVAELAAQIGERLISAAR
ncbi:MAG: LysR family transcriptional regulator [Cryobacterium sp.]|nr:LysR family transcriptional regulator [Cryobacterium sp.]